jgi:hypothetical protein
MRASAGTICIKQPGQVSGFARFKESSIVFAALPHTEQWTSSSTDGRQLKLPIVLPHSEMLPKNYARFCPEFRIECDENLSSAKTILQDTGPSW